MSPPPLTAQDHAKLHKARAEAELAELRLAQWQAKAIQLLCAAREAEVFIAGFEDDSTQEGVPQLLTRLRNAIAAAGRGAR